jgi:monoamine oxidase
VQLMLDKKLTVDEIHKLDKEMETRVLEPIARDAGQIRDPSQPWLEPWLEQFDKMSVADALVHRYGVKRSERLWKMIEFKLVNDEVAPLDEMNFLGLLCKVKAGQGVRFRSDDTGDLKERLMRVLMRYWNELEIFRCADGCQTLATKMADEIRTKYGAELRPSTAVTHINLSELGVALGVKKVKSNGEFADDKPPVFIPGGYGYVILAIPPSVWAGVKITVDGKDVHPKDKIGLMGMNPAVKFFSDVKERFWIKDKAAPNGGSSTLGQVWEGTDNQTRVEVKIPDPRGRPLAVKQGIVLSVFAGPILAGPRVPTRDEFKKELRRLYSGYTDDKLNKEPLLSNWPRVPFIMTGYASPTRGQIFTIGRELNKPWHERMFFAGEHTQMDFFGYMEGALRSGDRAAHALISKACGLLNGPVPASSKLPVITASTVPVRENTAFEYEAPLGEYSSTDSPGEAESPLTYQELFAEGPEEEWEPRAAALVAESPLVGALEDGRSRFDGYQSEEVEAAYNLEGEEESGAEEVREDELQLLLEQPLEERFDPSSIPSDVADALRKKDWPLALKLAIQAGWRDENDLTNLVFFARHQELPSEKLDPTGPNFKQLSAEWTKILNDEHRSRCVGRRGRRSSPPVLPGKEWEKAKESS